MGSETGREESPFVAGVHKLERAIHKVDIAEAPIPHTYDPALDPANQHVHPDRVHEGAGHGDRHTVFAKEGLPPRQELADLPNMHHHHGNDDCPNHMEPREFQRSQDFNRSETKDSRDEPELETNRERSVSSEEHDRKNTYQSEIGVADGDSSNMEGSYNEKSQEKRPMDKLKSVVRRHRWVIVLFFGLFFTSWWISIVAREHTRNHAKWLIPTFLWLFLMIRFITFYVPTRPLLMWANWVWVRTFIRVRDKIPEKFWVPIEGLCLAITVLVATTGSCRVFLRLRCVLLRLLGIQQAQGSD